MSSPSSQDSSGSTRRPFCCGWGRRLLYSVGRGPASLLFGAIFLLLRATTLGRSAHGDQAHSARGLSVSKPRQRGPVETKRAKCQPLRDNMRAQESASPTGLSRSRPLDVRHWRLLTLRLGSHALGRPGCHRRGDSPCHCLSHRIAVSVSAVAMCLALSAPALAAIVINEVESDGLADFIELMNTGGAPVDVSGYVLKDNETAARRPSRVAPAIPAGGYLAVDTIVRVGQSRLGAGVPARWHDADRQLQLHRARHWHDLWPLP